MKAPDRFIKSHDDWKLNAIRVQWIIIPLGLCAVTSSVLVAAFTAEMGIFWTKVVSTASALSVGYIAYFQLPKKLNDLWRGWRHFNGYLALYEADKIDLERLTAEYAKAEEMLGVIEIKPDIVVPPKTK
ncbi:MAG: hypothetical protein ED859_15355 [Desulfuromonadales bacterium]|nr:MAG: hypothetical protein ED859_15355 [Desulfuromonadales bacterium]